MGPCVGYLLERRGVDVNGDEAFRAGGEEFPEGAGVIEQTYACEGGVVFGGGEQMLAEMLVVNVDDEARDGERGIGARQVAGRQRGGLRGCGGREDEHVGPLRMCARTGPVWRWRWRWRRDDARSGSPASDACTARR